jgi:hypothetical protein
VVLACWQVWLTWRVTEQDRNLETERSRQRLDQVADLAVAELARTLSDWDLGLREFKSLPPASSLVAKLPTGAALIFISDSSVAVYPPRPLLFVPDAPSAPSASHAFDAADELELREEQYDHAMIALQPLVNDPATRLEALLRTARIQRKTGRPEASLETYQRLANEASLKRALNTTQTPYALVAANARCRILIELGRRDQAAAEAQSLRAALLEGRWRPSREAFEYYWSELGRIGIAAGQPPQSSIDFAALVSDLYDRWQRSTPAGTNASVRVQQPDSSLLMWNLTRQRLAALVTSAGWLDSSLRLPANLRDVRWKLLVPGVPAENALSITRSLGEAQLPGRLEFFSLAPSTGIATSRRALWVAGVVLMLMLVLASGYAVHRGISQESRVARLQSDFVADVSHEFRSPLTTLRTITELLAQNRITDESRR